MANPFDQFDAPEANPFDQFDAPKPKAPVSGGLVAAAKQAIGGTIKGAGQAAADFLPGVDQDNAIKRYGQGVVDANPTAVSSLADLKDKPLTGIAEATGNAGGSMGAMLGARALGMGITAASPLAGPAAPLIAGLGQAVSWAGPAAAAALPSFGGIREKQIQDDPTRQDSVGSKLLAAAGAGTVGLIESKLGPNKWAEMALSKQGRDALAEKFVANSLAGSIAKGAAKGAAIEGAEELAQNPIEQLASYQNPLTAENLKDTAFSGVMGALGGGVLGGASGAAFRGNPEKPGQNPAATPGDQSIPYSPTTVEEVAKARAEAMGIKPENGPLSVASGMAIEGQTAEEMRLSTPGILAQGAAVAEQSRIEQEARQAADPGIPFEHVAADPLRDASIVPTVPVIDPQIPTQDWINQQTGVDQSSGVTRRDFEVAAKEQADPQIILDESGRPKTTASALEIQQFHADFDRREALRQRNLSAAERLRAARSRKNIVEAAQPDEVAQPAAPVVVDVAQPAITEDPPALGFTPQKPEPMRATADGQVGTPQQFDDLARTKATSKDQMRRAEDRVREMVQAGARMHGRDLVAPSGAVVMPNLTLLQAAKARQFTREAPNAQQDQSQPAPAQAVQAEAQGSQQQPAVAPAQDLSSEAPLARPNIKESRNGTDNSLPNAEVAQKAPEGGGVVIRGGGNAVDARAGAGAEPKGRMPPESNPGVGQGALDANGEVAEQPNPAEPDSGVPDTRNPRAARKLVPRRGATLNDSRLSTHAEDIKAMSGDAGWQEIGGRMVRSPEGTVSRTKWLPRSEWFVAGMQSDPKALAEAIDRSARGLPIYAKDRRTISGMMDWLDAQKSGASLNEDSSAYDIEATGYNDMSEAEQDAFDLGEDLFDVSPAPIDGFLRSIGFTEDEIRAETQASRSESEDRRTPAREPREGAQGAGNDGKKEAGAILKSYSEQDLAARDEAQRLAEESRAKAEKAAEDKAQADAERDTFTLTGSDRAADVQAAQGQGGLFDAPAQTSGQAKAKPAPATPGGRWDAMTAERRSAVLMRSGAWSPPAGGLNVIGRQLSGRSWKEIPESARAAVEWAMGEHLAADFATRRAEIMKGLAKAGEVDSLYDFAGVKLAREFGRLSMKAQGDAYADYVMGGGAEIPATNQESSKTEARANADEGGGTADLIGARDIEIPAKAMRLLSDAEERDIVTVKSVGQSFENRLGIFNGGLHVPSEADIASQMKALSAARMGAEVEARAIGKYEAATARLIDQAIQHSAVGRTLSNVGTRKAAQAPAGAVTAGVQYRKAGIEFSNGAAAKLKEARDSAAFLEALRRRDSSRSSKVSVKSVADRLGLASPFAVQDPVPDSPAVGNAPNPLEALFSGLDSSSVRKANKAKKAAKAHPLADKIQNVQDNFLDILQELEDSGKVKINC